MTEEFIHLRCFSSYSLLEGALKIEDIVELCNKYKYPAIALTDSGNLFGSLEFSLECAKAGVQPIIGCTISVDFSELLDGDTVDSKLVMIAKDETGYQNLLKIVSNTFTELDHGNHCVNFDNLKKYSEGIICLTGGHTGICNKLLNHNQPAKCEFILSKLLDLFGDRLYIELQRIGIQNEEAIDKALIDLAYKLDIPLVATNMVMFSDMSMFEAHDVLLCISQGKYQVEEDRNRSHQEYYFKSKREMIRLFKDVPEAIENTVLIAKRCSVMSEARDPLLPSMGQSSEDEAKILRDEAFQGLEERLTGLEYDKQVYLDRLNYELDIITKMNFSGYFLIVSDFINWSKKNGIPVGPGRGSGAGSVVAWCLNITDLDPIKFGLVFERFLNPERISMPDFDIDFCQDRRDEVIKYVQQKYGSDRVAQIITFGKLQARAVLRDVGRVLQIPYPVVDRISKMIPFNAVNPVTLAEAIKLEPMLREARDNDDQIKRLIAIALKLEGLNRHASTHAAGVVIADRPLVELVPLYQDGKSEMLVVQYSMKYAEISGLVKFDFLGLKTLTVISDTVKLVNRHPLLDKIDIMKIPLNDEKTYQLLSRGDSIGVFQFEGSGMKDSLRKLRPDKIQDLMALGALFRPGPMDNIPTYLACKHGTKQPDYMHESLKETLEETFGVIIYQEQVLKIAQIMAGYSLGKADLLRRAMGKKIKKEMDDQRQMFVDGAVNNSYDSDQASAIFDLVAKFAGYGFNRAHAASYALISYQTAYLKANYPIEFITASLNLEISDTDKLNIFIQEAIAMNIEILPPDINKSYTSFVIEGNKIRYGLAALKNVGISAIDLLINERQNNSEYKDIFDFASRVDSKTFNKRQLESLIKAGAFDNLYHNRRTLFDSIEFLSNFNDYTRRNHESKQISLFASQPQELPTLQEVPEWSKSEKLRNEFEAFGFYLSDHPLGVYEEILNARKVRNWKYIRDELASGSHTLNLAAVPISTKTRSSPKGRYVTAVMSDCYGNFELSVFNNKLLEKSLDLIKSNVPLFIEAEIRKDEGGVRITANDIMPLDEYLNKGFKQLKISINQAKAVTEIKNYLASIGKGQTKIEMALDADNIHRVVIELPSRYQISQRDREYFSEIDGVLKAELI
jgi:DNA polymerase-3 subunit alpha